MDHLRPEISGEHIKIDIRAQEIEAYLDKPDFKRSKGELPDISAAERKFLAQSARSFYTRAKTEPDKERRLKLIERFNDSIALVVCDPEERTMAYAPAGALERVVFEETRDCLVYGTGTMSERVYFETSPKRGDQRYFGRCMYYPYRSTDATELGQKYYRRFSQAFGSDIVNLDHPPLEDLED